MKKIVIKMRSMKKMVGDDLLKLALMLSLLKVGPVNLHLQYARNCVSVVFVNTSHGSCMGLERQAVVKESESEWGFTDPLPLSTPTRVS